MDESNMHSRKRKRPSHHTNGENHHRHHTSHEHKHRPSPTDHPDANHHYSAHSHQVPRHHTRRQDNGIGVGVSLQASLSINVPAVTSIANGLTGTEAAQQSAASHTSNPETWQGPFPNSVFYETPSQQVMSPPPTPVPGSTPGSGSFSAGPSPTTPAAVASSPGSSQSPLSSESQASLLPSPNATVSSTLSSTASARMFNSLIAANSSTSTGSSMSASTSHTPSTTIYSSGVPLVPVFTTALRIPIPLTTSGRTIGTTFSTSYSVSYSALTRPTSHPPVSSAQSISQVPSSNTHANTRTGVAHTAASAAAGGVASNSNDSSNNTSVPTPTVVGGVVGGVAGLAIFLLLALLILRWYRRRRYGASLQDTSDGDLTRPYTAEAGAAAAGGASAAGGMGLLRRLSRRVGPLPAAPAPMMREVDPAAGGGSFQRIAGRKLPSQFSPGMVGPGPVPDAASTSDPIASYPSGSIAYPSGGTFASSAMTPQNPFSDPYSAGTSPTSPTNPTFSGPADLGAIAGIGIAHGEPSYHPVSSGGHAIRPSPARTPTMVQGEDNRASSHLASNASGSPPKTLILPSSRTPSPGPSLENHPALRPSGAWPSPFFGAGGGGNHGNLMPNSATRGRGYGSVGLGVGTGRGSPSFRSSSGSRFVEGDL